MLKKEDRLGGLGQPVFRGRKPDKRFRVYAVILITVLFHVCFHVHVTVRIVPVHKSRLGGKAEL